MYPLSAGSSGCTVFTHEALLQSIPRVFYMATFVEIRVSDKTGAAH